MTVLKRYLVFAYVSSLFVLTLCAAEKSWTGGAGDSLFSSGANWSPAGAPADGDALLFPNSSALSVVNDLVGHAFSGITASGSQPVTFQDTGHGFTLTGDIVVSGTRELNINVPVTLDSAVTFNLSNANFYAYGAITGVGGITLEGGKDFYAMNAVALTNGVTANKGRLRIASTAFTSPVTLNQLRLNSVTYVSLFYQTSGIYHFPITIANVDGSGYTLNTSSGSIHVTNTAPVTVAPSAYTRWKPDGSITYAGGIVIQTPARSDMAVVFNGNNVISEVPIDFPNAVYFDNGKLRFAVAGNSYPSLKCYTKTLYTDVPDALDPDANVLFGVGYSTNACLDINGNDQTINRPEIGNWSATSSYILTSSSGPATLTCRGTGHATFLGSVDGALTLSWEPTSAYTLTVTGRLSQTTGALQVKAGTLRLAAESAFPNLSSLAASGTGTLRVEGAEVSPGVTLTLADTALLDLPNGRALTCLSAQVDGNALTTGVYTASDTVGGRTFITGDGSLTVLTLPLSGTVRTWTGAGADALFSNVDNWDAAPAFDGSETFLFAEDGSAAIVDGSYRMGAIRFARSTPFTLTPSDETAGLRLGLGGITDLAPVAGTPVTNTLAAALTLSFGHAFQIGSNQTLAISGPISGGIPTAALAKTGDGTLRLTGTNTFESPLILSNGYIIVNNGAALGTPTNTVTIIPTVNPADSWNRRGFLYFTDTVATNDRHLIFGPSVYFIGQIYPKSGTLVLNGKFTFLGGGRIDNQGTLVFRGGFWSRNADPWMQTLPGSVMRFEEQPLDLGTHQIGVDNGGTFHVSSLSNTWASISLSSGTFLCGAENVMPTNSFASLGRSWTQRGHVDLNGFDQQLKYLTYSAGSANPTNLNVKSATPATLTLQGDTAARPFIGCFLGAASLRHRNTGTLAFTGAISASTTTGDLLIEAGTVAFSAGATWTGSTNITVTAGTLSVEGGAGTTFGGNDSVLNVTRLHLASASLVNLADGVTDYVRSATLDGEHLPVGTYGSASSAAQHKSALFTGAGILHVMRSEAPGTLILLQ
jgi:autotransporter-associated beta strand protein